MPEALLKGKLGGVAEDMAMVVALKYRICGLRSSALEEVREVATGRMLLERCWM
jgi:hypothetical protein